MNVSKYVIDIWRTNQDLLLWKQVAEISKIKEKEQVFNKQAGAGNSF